MLQRNEDHVDGVPDWALREGWHWYIIFCAGVWCIVALPCLIVGVFLCGWYAFPLAALFATMMMAETMENLAA